MKTGKVHRLDSPETSEYALFVEVSSGKVHFRHFQYYGGPTVNETCMLRSMAREMYASLLRKGWTNGQKES